MFAASEERRKTPMYAVAIDLNPTFVGINQERAVREKREVEMLDQAAQPMLTLSIFWRDTSVRRRHLITRRLSLLPKPHAGCHIQARILHY